MAEEDTNIGSLPLIKEEAESDFEVASEAEMEVDKEGTSMVVSDVSMHFIGSEIWG